MLGFMENDRLCVWSGVGYGFCLRIIMCIVFGV